MESGIGGTRLLEDIDRGQAGCEIEPATRNRVLEGGMVVDRARQLDLRWAGILFHESAEAFHQLAPPASQNVGTGPTKQSPAQLQDPRRSRLRGRRAHVEVRQRRDREQRGGSSSPGVRRAIAQVFEQEPVAGQYVSSRDLRFLGSMACAESIDDRRERLRRDFDTRRVDRPVLDEGVVEEEIVGAISLEDQ